MNRHGYVVAKGMVVQHIDGEEQQDIDEPSAKRDDVWSKEERRTRFIELRYIASDGDEQKLNKGYERSYVAWISICARDQFYRIGRVVIPFVGSKLYKLTVGTGNKRGLKGFT